MYKRQSDIYIDLDVCDNQHIAEAWKKLSTDQLDNTMRDFLEIRIRMQLCDWAYLNLIDTFANDHFGIDVYKRQQVLTEGIHYVLLREEDVNALEA